MRYVNRGDPATEDFDKEALVIDGNWHELDLSGIVAEAGANHLVHILAALQGGEAFDSINFQELGNLHEINVDQAASSSPGRVTKTSIWVMLDASKKLNYQALTEIGFQALGLTVRGWWEG